ncbi:MAG: hypothetical protein ACRDBL_07770 [Rhabdaerophilum sp.]
MTIETVLLSLASAIIGGLVVAFANHWMTKRRDIEAKRREIALTRLVDAWLALDAASEKPNVRDGDIKKLEEAVRTIVLFADDEEIDLAEQVAKSFLQKKQAVWTELQISLRQRIRSSMGIKGRKRHFWFAVEPSEKK